MGVAGTSGTSGSGGGSLAIYNEGNLVTSSAVSLNFVGSCISATGGSEVTITVDCTKQWIIASHSGSFYQPANDDVALFYVGNDICGWDSCDWNFATSLRRGANTPVLAQYSNIGIVNPFNLSVGDNIRVCGTAYAQGATPADWFNMSLTVFKCSEISNDGASTPIDVSEISGDDYSNFSTTCFNSIVTLDSNITACDGLFQLGFNSQLATAATVKFSWTLSVIRT